VDRRRRTLAAVGIGALVVCGTLLPIGAADALGAEDPPPANASPLADSAAVKRREFSRLRMGTEFRIVFYTDDEALANRAADAAYARVKDLDAILSDYDPESEAMTLCRESGPGRPVAASPDLLRCLQSAASVSKSSHGAFDVTVGPLTGLWRIARRERRLPEQAVLDEARARIGYENVRIDPEAQTVELLRPGMRLDFGGIGKGYAADEALAVLERHGIRRALVAAGGDIVLGDAPPDAPAWRVGIAPLDRPDGPPSRTLALVRGAVSTSGDVFQHVEIAGRRYSHLVDPRTGLGTTDPSSTTVVARRGTEADAWASAVSVLGPERGLAAIEKLDGAAAYVVRRDAEGRTVEHVSSRFAQWLAQE
jgi:thiamine biosynthesis lipoprotein